MTAATRDRSTSPVDITPIRDLIERIVAAWRPEQVWLFGSRARGESNEASDWDLLAVVPDELPEDAMGPVASWQLAKDARAHADVVPCRASDFQSDRDTPNTIVYEVARRGVLLYER